MPDIRLIVGLGNPGKEYTHTRHNLGFIVVERLAQDLKLSFKKSSFTNGFVAHGECEGKDTYFLLPTTFMNLSGLAVKSFIQKKTVDVGHLLVVCDDVTIDFGRMRLRPQGSDGGHNGLDSIIEHLGTKEFARLRLGVGPQPTNLDLAEYVLAKFRKEELNKLGDFIDQSANCCRAWLKEGTIKAMDQFNRLKE